MGNLILDIRYKDVVHIGNDKDVVFDMRLKSTNRNRLTAVLELSNKNAEYDTKSFVLDFRKKLDPIPIEYSGMELKIYPKYLRKSRCYLLFQAESAVKIKCEKVK